MSAVMSTLYRRVADHYQGAIETGTLAVGDRMPSVRALMRTHGVSLTTALQACRHLEGEGWLEARPRSGYFVRRRRAARSLAPAAEVAATMPPDPAAYVGIHAKVSEIVVRGQQRPVRLNLALAVGAPELYPVEALKNAMVHHLRRQPQTLTTMARFQGIPVLKAALAKHALPHGMQVAPDEVTVTHGCIEALNLALRAVARPGDTIAVESPTYYGLLQVLESLGLRALEIPTSPHTGLALDALEFALARDSGIKAVVAMPNMQNPLGSSMPDAHKQRLVQLCQAHDIALIEDDIYGTMTDDPAPLKTAKAFDDSGHVIYCNSLNKMLAPGLRLGWMIAGRWQARVEMLKFAQTRYSEELPQMVAAEYVGSGAFERHLQRLRAALKRQRERMAEGVAAHFPAGTRLSVPAGGMLLWIELPDRLPSEPLFDAALAEGIKIAPGTMFSNSKRFDHFIRLSSGWPYSEDVDRALQRLGQLTAEMAA
jgi:DNA-binding transcriptional MocR family regulator